MNYLSLIKKYGLNEIKEQKEFLTNPSFENPVKPLVLAGGTGFGKTFTTILKLIMFYSNPENKGKKTIILPSSTKVLRNNFGESMDTFSNLPFNYCVCTGKRDFKRAVNHSDCDVIIVLPQTLANIKELPKVEWLVVDEAHKWYFADTIRGIIAKTKPSYQLLLTGTPFKFNANKREYTIFYVPIEDMIAAGNVGNPLIEVISSSLNLKDEDFIETSSNEPIRRDIKWLYKEDKDNLISVAKEISKTLKTRYRTNTIGRLLGVFGIDKTIIYCYSKKQARHFYKIFQKSDLAGKVLLSDSESDIDSTEFNKFKEEEDYRVLLVVDRGKEGFDMPELFNIIDFTLSTNPEVILQILGRVLRISKLQPNKQKIYYKVASMNTAPFVLTLMTGILQLINREYYETFTGKFSEIKVPMMPIKRKKREKVKNNRTQTNFSTRALSYFQDVNIPLEANFWNQLKFRQGDIWKTMGQTSLDKVISEMKGRTANKGYNYLTYEYCKKESSKFNSRKEFAHGNTSAYQKSMDNKEWINEFFPLKDLSYEGCKKEASKYKSRFDFRKGSQSHYEKSLRKVWLDDFLPKQVVKVNDRKYSPEYITKLIENNLNNLPNKSALAKQYNVMIFERYNEYLKQGLVKDYFNKGGNNFTLKTK